MYRLIDFKRDKREIPAKVASIEYDPNRSARIALLHYHDGEKRYIIMPDGLKVDQMIVSTKTNEVEITPGNRLPLERMPLGTLIHAVELRPGEGAKLGRGAGVMIRLMAVEGPYATLKLPFS